MPRHHGHHAHQEERFARQEHRAAVNAAAHGNFIGAALLEGDAQRHHNHAQHGMQHIRHHNHHGGGGANHNHGGFPVRVVGGGGGAWKEQSIANQEHNMAYNAAMHGNYERAAALERDANHHERNAQWQRNHPRVNHGERCKIVCSIM